MNYESNIKNTTFHITTNKGQFFKRYHFSPVENNKMQGTRFYLKFTGKLVINNKRYYVI